MAPIIALAPDSLLSWTLYGGFIVGTALAFFALYSLVGSWLTPRVRRMQRGEAAGGSKRLYCCPAGLGCNDVDSTWRQCRRQRAREVANGAEFMELESAWSAFCGAHSPTAKRKSLATYEGVRDGIIARQLSELKSPKNERLQLLAGKPEDVDGEVVSSRKKNKTQSPYGY